VTNANRKRQLAVETAAKEGLRASVPLYVAAAEAFVQEDRPAQGVEFLGELLRAKEKRRGLFARVEKNPLGPERLRVAVKYAELARMVSPTEDTLELLEDLSTEFPDTATIRKANADGLRNAGYASDAIEEYQQCARLEPAEADIPVRLSELNAALGRTDEAVELLRHGIELHAAASEYEQVADRAMRFIDLNADGLDDVFRSLELIPGDVLRKHVPSLDHVGVLVRRDPSRPEETRIEMEHQLVALYERVLEADGRNAAARRGINVLGPQYLAEVEARLKAGSAARAQAAQAAVNAAQASTAVAAPVKQAVAPPPPEPQSPELVERSPGELIAEETVASPAAKVTPPPPKPATPQPAPPQPKPAPAQAKPTQPQPAATQPPPAAKVVQPQPKPAAPQPAAPQPAPQQAAPQPAAPQPAPQQAAPQPKPQQAPPVQPAAAKATPPPAPPRPVPQPAAPQPAAPQPATAQPVAPPAAPPLAAPQPVAAQPAAPAQTAPAPTAAPASAPSRALYAFALRKAQEQFDAGHFEEAAQACDRLLKRGEIAEVLQLLVRCYIKLDRKPEAVVAGLRFAEAAAAEDSTKALESLTELIKQLPDPALILRRSQLLSSLRQVEFVGKDG
jgi:tetratricopeptide (TPR) repeat protein